MLDSSTLILITLGVGALMFTFMAVLVGPRNGGIT